jgi:hypothetical protein
MALNVAASECTSRLFLTVPFAAIHTPHTLDASLEQRPDRSWLNSDPWAPSGGTIRAPLSFRVSLLQIEGPVQDVPIFRSTGTAGTAPRSIRGADHRSRRPHRGNSPLET